MSVRVVDGGNGGWCAAGPRGKGVQIDVQVWGVGLSSPVTNDDLLLCICLCGVE